jgi:hypothetical protein
LVSANSASANFVHDLDGQLDFADGTERCREAKARRGRMMERRQEVRVTSRRSVGSPVRFIGASMAVVFTSMRMIGSVRERERPIQDFRSVDSSRWSGNHLRSVPDHSGQLVFALDSESLVALYFEGIRHVTTFRLVTILDETLE